VNTGQPSDFRFPLLPHRFRIIGFVLIAVGLVPGYLYYFGGRPDFFQVPVFAIASTYAESRFFVFARTNLLDELFAIFCITGLVMVVFSKEKTEPDGINLVRASALIRAVQITLGVWLLSFLVIFGWAILVVTGSMFLFFLIAYYVAFRILLHRAARRKTTV
jgi:hypothetical protein